MQVFLPYPSFEKSLQCLDYRRLGKQRVEAGQIINILTGKTSSKAWRNHPAVLMFKGYENSLKIYYNLCLTEWIKRGYKNNMIYHVINGPVKNPPWLGNDNFHASHRSNLLRKDYNYYSKFGWIEKIDLPYYWPNKEGY
jgi:hypothetical protein